MRTLVNSLYHWDVIFFTSIFGLNGRKAISVVIPQLNRHTVETWLHRLPSAPVNYPDVAQMLVEWIEAKQWDRTADLVDAAWANVILPE